MLLWLTSRHCRSDLRPFTVVIHNSDDDDCVDVVLPRDVLYVVVHRHLCHSVYSRAS